jgi:hypothetical protein
MRLGRADDTFGDEDVLLYISVDYASGNSVQASCGNWSLNVAGEDGADDCTCDGTPNGDACD